MRLQPGFEIGKIGPDDAGRFVVDLARGLENRKLALERIDGFFTRGKLGFNCRYLIEMGEETGSPGLRELISRHTDFLLWRACDVADEARSSSSTS